MKLTTSYLNSNTRLYFNTDDKMVAIAFNPTWGTESNIDSMTQYRCLEGVFDCDNQTQIVNPEKLSLLYQQLQLVGLSHYGK